MSGLCEHVHGSCWVERQVQSPGLKDVAVPLPLSPTSSSMMPPCLSGDFLRALRLSPLHRLTPVPAMAWTDDRARWGKSGGMGNNAAIKTPFLMA